jgi:hypothetical protein
MYTRCMHCTENPIYMVLEKIHVQKAKKDKLKAYISVCSLYYIFTECLVYTIHNDRSNCFYEDILA